MVIYGTMQETDTICAIATAPGEGGIGIIRISGSDAVKVASVVFRPHRGRPFARASHRLQYGRVIDPATGESIDEALMSVMRAPGTYTREDVVEINCHGGMMPLSRTLRLVVTAGARQAEPGEFTKRAFLNGRIDLSQAEAVMDVIRAKTDLAHKAAEEQLLGGLSREIALLRDRLLALMASVEAAIDFPEEDIETTSGSALMDGIAGAMSMIDEMLATAGCGRLLREGFGTAIVGRPNVGKSSLLNSLLRQDRAIVTDVPGTTRDVLEEYLNIAGAPLRILDTAGIRHSHDVVEQEGVRRTLGAIAKADLVLIVLDGAQEMTAEDRRVLDEVGPKPAVIVINKADLPRRFGTLEHPGRQVSVSCRTGAGLNELRDAVSTVVLSGTVTARSGHSWAVNQRHNNALQQAKESLMRVQTAVREGISPEFVAVDLRAALDQLGIIIGATYTEDILEKIFNEFCIGK